MTIRNLRMFTLALVFFWSTGAMFAQQTPGGLSEGLREYQAGNFQTALGAFEQAREEAAGTEFQPYAEFWVARSLMALGRYPEAADGFDLFRTEYPLHPYLEEATYQRARLFYLTGDYEAAVRMFADFEQAYPDSTFTANALYWSGESLFSLGRLPEARRLFEEVIEQYPTSFRVEAARYRKDIIDLKQRENELLTLLQWSHEEYLTALDDFRQKELSYQEALQAYRDRLRSLAAEDFQEEIDVLSARVAELEDTVAERDAQVNNLLAQLRQAQSGAATTVQSASPADAQNTSTPATPASGDTTANAQSVQSELLSLKAAALELQRRLLDQGSAQ